MRREVYFKSKSLSSDGNETEKEVKKIYWFGILTKTIESKTTIIKTL